MIHLKKIRMSSLIFAFCVLQWSTIVVESAITAGDSSSKLEITRTEDKGRGVPSNILNSIYHKNRQSRCATCYEDRRYGDDRSRYYSNYAARSGDERTGSWYYPRYDRYDDRGYRASEYNRNGASGADRYGADHYGGYRYSSDRYSADRYETADRYAGYRDNQYGARPSYDRYDTQSRDPYERSPAYDRGEGRGYSYGNRDRYYGSDRDRDRDPSYYSRDRYYERPRYGATAGSSSGYGGYDRDYYDRYSTRYDCRHCRPSDGTYRRRPEYDGYQQDRHYLPEPNYNSPCGVRKVNCRHNPQDEGTRVSSGPIDSGPHNMGVSHTSYNTHSNRNHNESSKGSGTPSGWSYMREDEQSSRDGTNGSYSSNNNNNNNNNNKDRSSDKQSSGYGALLDRGSNLIAVEEPVKSNESANDSTASSDMQKDTDDDKTPKQSDNEEKS